VYDVAAGLPVLLDDGARRYVWGANGLAHAVEGTGNGTPTTYHADGLGSVRALTDASGAVVQTYQADEFGVPIAAGTQGTRTQPFGFTGEQRDAETGFSYLRARMYDPQVGRFLQRDPFPGRITSPLSLNRFTYVANNPASLVDPAGLTAATPRVQRQAEREDRGLDNDCFPGGVLNILCTHFPLLKQVEFVIPTPFGPPRTVTLLFPVSPGRDSGGGDERPGGDERNWRQDRRVSDSLARQLKRRGIDPEELKESYGGYPPSRFDLYQDTNRQLYVKPKGGRGPGVRTHVNLRDVFS